jgi:hypothetical protein
MDLKFISGQLEVVGDANLKHLRKWGDGDIEESYYSVSNIRLNHLGKYQSL